MYAKISLCPQRSVCVDAKAEFIHKPTSKNVSEGQIVEFNCTAIDASNIAWKWNGDILLTNRSGLTFTKTKRPPYGAPDIRTTILSATAFLDANGANVTCVIFTQSPPSLDESQPPALMLVQGIVDNSNLLLFVAVYLCTCDYITSLKERYEKLLSLRMFI